MEPEVLLRLPRGADSPRFSPDGSRLAYCEGGRVWVAPVEPAGVGEGLERLELGPGERPRWFPIGGALAVLRREGPASCVWRRPLNSTAEAVPLTPNGMAVRDFALSPDGGTIAIIDGSRPSALYLGVIPGSGGGLPQGAGTVRERLRLPAGEAPRRLSWSPDGRHLAWSAVRQREDRREAVYEVRVLAVEDGPLRSVVSTGACQTNFPGAPYSDTASSAGAWRPDGRALAFAATPHPWGNYAVFGLATWHLRGGAARYLTRDPMAVFGIAWAPDGQTVYVSARCGGSTEHLYAVSVGTGADGALPPPRQLTFGGAHHQNPVVSPDGRWLACEVEAPDRRLAGVEGLRLLESAPVHWRSADGLELEGFALFPPGYGPAHAPPRPLPTVVDLHGGPNTVAPWRRLGDRPPVPPALYFTGLHYLAEQGYLCFAADYRETGSYGWRALEPLVGTGTATTVNATDVLAGVDRMVELGWADPARLGLRGHSHGASLVNWLVTQTPRFRAAVSHEGVTDVPTMAAATSPNTIVEAAMGGAPDEVPERYRRASPLEYAAQARTPTLLIEGERGPFAPHRQGERFRDALTAAGVEVEYVCYPGEGHGIGRPEHQLDYLRRTLAWFDRHLRGGGR